MTESQGTYADVVSLYDRASITIGHAYLINHTVNYPAQMRRKALGFAYLISLQAAYFRQHYAGEGYPVMHASDAGCYVDGHWGQYAVAHMIERATEFGYRDAQLEDYATRHLASMGPGSTTHDDSLELGGCCDVCGTWATDPAKYCSAPGITDDEHEAMSEGADDVVTWLNTYAVPEGHSWGWEDGEFFLWPDETWEDLYGAGPG